MKRCLLAAVTLVAVDFGLASADYVIVKIDLNQVQAILNSANQPAPQGGPGGRGNPALPPGGQFVPGGIGGVQNPPRGGGGLRPGFRPFGTAPLKPAQPPLPGQFPMPGQQPGAGGAAAPPPGPQLPPLYVYAFVEVKKLPLPNQVFPANQQVPFNIWPIECKFDNQKLELLVPEDAMSYHSLGDLVFPKIQPLTVRFYTKFNTDIKDGNDESKKKKMVLLAEWALQRGLLAEFTKSIEELKKVDAKHPVVMAVEKTREELKKKPADDDPAAQSLKEDLRKQAYRPLPSDEGHYTLMTNSPVSDRELKKKLTRLEEVYTTFFYWYALKGQPWTPPAYRLVAVLVDTPKAEIFQRKRAEFNFVPMVGGGFTAQRDNVLVLASRRMNDEAFEKLDDFNQGQWAEYGIADSTELLTKPNEFLRNPHLAQSRKSPLVVLSVLQTLALCQKAMAEESELLALSHGGVRQLMAATGLMPANVETAEWARFGLASFFEVPQQSFYPSSGGLNWSQLVEFKALRRAKVLDKKDARDILLKVITDDYFRQAYSTGKLAELTKDERGTLRHKAEEELDVARATAWSLMYHLAFSKPTQLERYFEEIRGLPRDLAYDNKVLRDCFFRAFGLLRADPDNAGRQALDVVGLETLATAWFTSADKTWRLDVPAYEELAVTWRLEDLKARHPQPSPSGILQPGQGTPPGGVLPGDVPPGGVPPDPAGNPPIGGKGQ